MKRIITTMVVIGLLLVTASAAYAGGSSTMLSGYAGNAGALTKTPPAKVASVAGAVTPKGTLPFTGMDLGVAAAGGIALAAAGLALRRSSRQSQ